MDFTLSTEQQMLKDSAARFAASERFGDPWSTFAELGWLGIGAPEDCGGFGGPLETLLLMEQFGRGLVVSPYAGQVVAASAILAGADQHELLGKIVEGDERVAVAYEEPRAHYDPSAVATTASRSSGAWRLHGTKVRVLGAGSATRFIVSARHDDGIALFSIAASGTHPTVRAYAAEDGHDIGEVTFEDAPGAELLGAPADGLALLERGLDHAVAALGAEAVGIMGGLLETTVSYTKARRQFDVPIGSFQALQHRMAEMFIELELARSMAYLAALGLAESDVDRRRRAVSGAKVQIAKAARFVGQNAIQLHGGIGMSEEYSVGHAFKRLTMLERTLGDRAFHLARFSVGDARPATADLMAAVGRSNE